MISFRTSCSPFGRGSESIGDVSDAFDHPEVDLDIQLDLQDLLDLREFEDDSRNTE